MPKFVVTIGGFGHEGLNANIKSLGYEILPYSLEKKKQKTWQKRAHDLAELVENNELAATIIYLHTTLLLQASRSDYRAAFDQILESALKSKAIVFIFQDNLDGMFSIRHYDTRQIMTLNQLEQLYEEDPTSNLENAINRLRDYQDRQPEVEALISHIYDSRVEVAPFYIRSDVTIRLQEFLGDIEQGVFLRLFIPNDRLQAEQLSTLLSILERYLRQVEGQNFSIDSKKSEKGVFGKHESTQSGT